MDWQRMSTHEHARRAFTTALLPVGTIEAHDGAPLGTDNYIPAELGQRLSERLEIPCLPVMPYGVTKSLLAFSGSCGVSEALLEQFLFEVGRSLARNGLRYLFVLDGHGGNFTALKAGAARLHQECGLFTAVIEWWHEAESIAIEIFGEGGLGHSAVDELGMLVGLCPELEATIPKQTVSSYYLYKGVKPYPAPHPVLTYGRPDDPVDLSRLEPEKCRRFAEQVTDLMARIVREILTGWQGIGRATD